METKPANQSPRQLAERTLEAFEHALAEMKHELAECPHDPHLKAVIEQYEAVKLKWEVLVAAAREINQKTQ
jgi:hypothetical protein